MRFIRRNSRNDQIKDDIKNASPEILLNHNIIETARKSGIICPNCGNGSGKDGTGILPTDYKGAPSYYCHKCGTHFDNLDLIARHFNLDIKQDFPKVLAEGATLLGGAANLSVHSVRVSVPVKKITEETEEKIPQDFSGFIEEAFVNIEDIPVSARRGLSLKTLEHFNCGFAPSWRHPKSPNAPFSARLIIPTSKFHYLARAISSDVSKQYSKQHAGTKEIFNIDVLTPNSTVIVVEGEFDCMSIRQVSDGKIPAVAVSGCANYKLLLDWLDKNSDCNIKFIVMFDNDSSEGNPGQTNAKKFVDELNKRGFPAVNKLLSDKMDFDANDWLQQDESALGKRIAEIYSEGSTELENIAEEIKATALFNKKVASFEKSDGKIPDDNLTELKNAIAFLRDISVDKISSDLLDSADLRRALGFCSFYYFENSRVTNFLNLFKEAKEIAKKSDDDTLKSLLNFSPDDLRKIIKISARTVEKSHNDFQKQLKIEKYRQEREQRKLQRLQRFQENSDRLEVLKNLPQSPERDEELIQLIRDNCDWQCDNWGRPLFIKPSTKNYDLIFNYDPVIQGLFGYDEFFRDVVFLRQPHWHEGRSVVGESLQKQDENILFLHIARTYDDISSQRIFDKKVDEVARQNSFNPIKKFLESLPKWDGTTRVEKVFIDFLDVDDTPYSREVTLKFFIAAVARLYHPGCEYQYVPILQGEQGIGKGYVVKRLAQSWFIELRENLSSSHALDAIQRGWFIEIPEMSAMSRTDINTVKAFTSARDDTHRFAYERRAATVKRQGVFFSNSNKKFPLRDQTGNRRFPILECHRPQCGFVEGLTDDYVKQFWAEVLVKYNELFKDGFDDQKLLLSKESLKTFNDITDKFTEDDGMVGEILAFLDTPIPYPVVWNLLSREERRNFIANFHINIRASELIRRQAMRKRPEEMKLLQAIINNKEDSSIFYDVTGNFLSFYGVTLRNSVCASEIYNECYGYGYDQRKSMGRISEILARELPAEWRKFGRKKSSVYGDQKTVYVRDVPDPEIIFEPECPVQDIQEDKIAEEDLFANAREVKEEDLPVAITQDCATEESDASDANAQEDMEEEEAEEEMTPEEMEACAREEAEEEERKRKLSDIVPEKVYYNFFPPDSDFEEFLTKDEVGYLDEPCLDDHYPPEDF